MGVLVGLVIATFATFRLYKVSSELAENAKKAGYEQGYEQGYSKAIEDIYTAQNY